MPMPDFRAAHEKVRPSIVGLGITTENGEISVIGTGFFYTDEGHIITNKHVLEGLLIERDGRKDVASGARAWVSFPHSNQGTHSIQGMVALRIGSALTFPNPFEGKDPMASAPTIPNFELVAAGFPEEADIAILEAILPKDLDFEIPFVPVDIHRVDSSFAVGTPVGILGYPGGLSFDSSNKPNQSLQLTPLLQTGIVAGVLPFPNVPNPETFVLDIYVTPGSSGSPVFDMDGNVVGLVYATRMRTWPLLRYENGQFIKSGTEFAHVPTSLGLALPSARFSDGLFEHIKASRSKTKA